MPVSLGEINLVTVIIVVLFILPVIAGGLRALSGEAVRRSIISLLDNIEFIAGMLLSVYIVKRIFFVQDGSVFNTIYNLIPQNIRDQLFQRDVLTYLIAVPVVLIFLLLFIRFITNPLYRYVFIPVSEAAKIHMHNCSKSLKRFLGAVWQIPKGIAYVLIFAFVLNFTSYYIYSEQLSKWTNESPVYQVIYKNVMLPVLNSNLAKEVPVLVNDSFRNAMGLVIPRGISEASENAAEAIEKLSGGNIRVIEYFNGMTLEEAIKSNEEIDKKAMEIVGNETDDVKKAREIYNWICKNIKYDHEKAEKIVKDSGNIASGSIVAFETRKGICFDYSCLYVSMCRAVGLKVRLITGIAYSGTSWGDHAWNQVYDSGDDVWINVDTTFGASGINYFGKRDFYADHREPKIQGEW